MPRSRTLAAAALTGVAALAMTATPAAAAAPAGITWWNSGAPNGCAGHGGALCAYKDAFFGGRVAYFVYSNPRWSQTSNSWIDDQSSSWYNNGTGTSLTSVIIYQDVNYNTNTLHVCIDKGWGISHYPELSDKVSSNQWVNGPC
ncbi:peptidase inhibitor family I36 protein [Fodinicola acaciae]|uniref:peptidase inhibitor family I36 protein n=1 Tax=Fodinicola acaciae TaxID=2681555 RepID=UPI0013D0CC22|nr:peptidase inhibitor family I36 protein [Fodinicola acaciae]